MWEILVSLLLFVALVGAAKRRRKKQRLSVPKFVTTCAVGALADATVSVTDMTDTDRTRYLISADAVWTMRDHTAGEGPIEVGYAHGIYSATEIKEAIESGASWASDTLTALEKSRRKVRMVGVFPGLSTEEVLNDGKPIRTKLNFTITDGENLSVYVYNRSGGSLTTGTIITCDGVCYTKLL